MPLQAPKKHVTGESHLSGKQKQIPLVHKSHEIPYSISIHFSIFILCVLFYFFPFSSYLNTSNLPKTHPSHRKSDLNFLLKERCWRQILIQILEGQGLSPLNHFNLFYIFLGILAKKQTILLEASQGQLRNQPRVQSAQWHWCPAASVATGDPRRRLRWIRYNSDLTTSKQVRMLRNSKDV